MFLIFIPRSKRLFGRGSRAWGLSGGLVEDSFAVFVGPATLFRPFFVVLDQKPVLLAGGGVDQLDVFSDSSLGRVSSSSCGKVSSFGSPHVLQKVRFSSGCFCPDKYFNPSLASRILFKGFKRSSRLLGLRLPSMLQMDSIHVGGFPLKDRPHSGHAVNPFSWNLFLCFSKIHLRNRFMNSEIT